MAESELQGFLRRDEGEKSQEYYVYFKISKQNRGEKRLQSAEVPLDRRLPYQEAFFTPGIWPLYASSRKQIRQMP